MSRVGLLLTGGGARAAYQAGVLRGVSEILNQRECPFPVITGISAGAINASYLSCYADDFRKSTEGLWNLWSEIKTDTIFKTSRLSLFRIGIRWIRDLVFGGVTGISNATYLLNADPLAKLLAGKLDMERLKHNCDTGVLHGVAFTATNYKTGTAVSFYDGSQTIDQWLRTSRIGIRSDLKIEHVLASASIPILFPPVKLGNVFYGDGSVRMSAPLSPPIHLGADRVFSVGVRFYREPEETLKLNLESVMDSISLVDIGGVMLNSIFLDSMDADLERMERINRTIQTMTEEQKKNHPNRLKEIPVYAVRPSEDLGKLAAGAFKEFPQSLRYLLRGIGGSHQKGWDLLSYLAFEQDYTSKLLKLGYDDVLREADAVRKFIKG
ncbi:MAG: patatin-like phospholipase family protein [Xanthomonadaceae bacterium]|nr:patatin-like phospholipase family protein [Xanthomonadaceae bacterium]